MKFSTKLKAQTKAAQIEDVNDIPSSAALRASGASVEPEPMTRDPFDRILLAATSGRGLRLVTIHRALVMHPLAARG
jgi:PIN domain nuclease of toxin-antitoxin system